MAAATVTSGGIGDTSAVLAAAIRHRGGMMGLGNINWQWGGIGDKHSAAIGRSGVSWEEDGVERVKK